MFLLAALSLSTPEANACGMYIPDDYVLAELIEDLAEPVEENRTMTELFEDLAPTIAEPAPESELSQPSERPLS